MSHHFNFFRKIFHISGLMFVFIYFYDVLRNFPAAIFAENTRSILFIFLAGVYLSLLVIEFLRFRFQWAQNAFLMVAGKLLKPEEADSSHGSLPFFLGLALCTAFFNREITIIAFLSLMIGDPMAAWFGIRYGRHKITGKKSLEGFLAGTAGSFFAGLVFLVINSWVYPENFFGQILEKHPLLTLLALLMSALTAFTGELFAKNGFFDDNFVIPVLSGASLSLFIMLFFGSDIGDLFYSPLKLLIPLHEAA